MAEFKDDENYRKVQNKLNFDIFWHDLRVKDKIINNKPFMFVKRKKEDNAYLWIDRSIVKFL